MVAYIALVCSRLYKCMQQNTIEHRVICRKQHTTDTSAVHVSTCICRQESLQMPGEEVLCSSLPSSHHDFSLASSSNQCKWSDVAKEPRSYTICSFILPPVFDIPSKTSSWKHTELLWLPCGIDNIKSTQYAWNILADDSTSVAMTDWVW